MVKPGGLLVRSNLGKDWLEVPEGIIETKLLERSLELNF
jgi:hypothetical protein